MTVVLVCGGRDFDDREFVWSTLDHWHDRLMFTQLIHGACPTGADALADAWARERHIPIRRFPADWKANGRAAGPIRNQHMLDIGAPDAVVVFPGGNGTLDMLSRARVYCARMVGARLIVVKKRKVMV